MNEITITIMLTGLIIVGIGLIIVLIGGIASLIVTGLSI